MPPGCNPNLRRGSDNPAPLPELAIGETSWNGTSFPPPDSTPFTWTGARRFSLPSDLTASLGCTCVGRSRRLLARCRRALSEGSDTIGPRKLSSIRPKVTAECALSADDEIPAAFHLSLHARSRRQWDLGDSEPRGPKTERLES